MPKINKTMLHNFKQITVDIKTQHNNKNHNKVIRYEFKILCY